MAKLPERDDWFCPRCYTRLHGGRTWELIEGRWHHECRGKDRGGELRWSKARLPTIFICGRGVCMGGIAQRKGIDYARTLEDKPNDGGG